jgi:hypothetical protein
MPSMPERSVTPGNRWTLSFYQDRGGVREITVRNGPCLVGGSTIEVVPAAEVERLREALRRIEDVTTNEPDAVEAATRASHIAHDALKHA